MTTRPKQIDLEQVIAKTPKQPQGELPDAFTGVVFVPRTRNHYEVPDPKPFAPNLAIQRPTVRQRVENLLSRGIDPLHDFMRQQADQDELDFEVPDDPEAPLTQSEQNHIDMLASQIAEQAPLPDDGLPRPPQAPSMQQTGAEGGGEPEGGVHSDSAPPSEEPPPGRPAPPSPRVKT